MASSALVPIRGQQVLFQEGDILVTTSPGLRNNVLLVLNRGVGAHASTVVKHRGELVAVSVCPGGWTDEHGVHWPGGGLTREPLRLFGDKAYTHLSICRPRLPRSPAAIAALRLVVTDLFRAYGTDTPCYDDWHEFLASGMHWKRATTDKWHCGELAAWLCKVQGAWPEDKTVSVDVGTLLKIAGKPEDVY
jgi:hypothetical protein